MKRLVFLPLLFLSLAVMSQHVTNGFYSSNFGTTGNIGQNENDAYVFDNSHGFSTIAFKITSPTGGAVDFEATFDGINWESISLRSVDNDIFQSSTDNGDNYIGSIAGAKFFRVRTSTAGSAPGSVIGRATTQVSILEGIEFGHPPHRFGFEPVHKDKEVSTAITGDTVWQPVTGKKFVITDIIVIASGSTDGTVTIFDETDAAGNRVFKSEIEVATNKQFVYIHPLKTPFVSSAADNILRVTTSTNIHIDIMVHGYEI